MSDLTERIWERDPSLWTDDADVAARIADLPYAISVVTSARQRVLEKIRDAELPDGVTPQQREELQGLMAAALIERRRSSTTGATISM